MEQQVREEVLLHLLLLLLRHRQTLGLMHLLLQLLS
jgi:hypothetical protein